MESNFAKARASIVWIAALLTAFYLVWRIERASAPQPQCAPASGQTR